MTDSLQRAAVVITDPHGFASNISDPLHKMHTAAQVDTRIAVIAILLTALGVVATLVVFRLRKMQERKALKGILEDLLRHFKTNMAISGRIDLDKGIPSTIHLRKFKVDSVCLVFDPDTCKSIKKRYLPMFNRLRLKYRNGNLELDTACDYLKSGDYDRQVMKGYVAMARDRQMELCRLTEEFLTEHYGSYKEEPPKKEEEEGFVIFYEKLY